MRGIDAPGLVPILIQSHWREEENVARPRNTSDMASTSPDSDCKLRCQAATSKSNSCCIGDNVLRTSCSVSPPSVDLSGHGELTIIEHGGWHR